jgi:hypothetical protein
MNWRFARATAIGGCACSTPTNFVREAKINIGVSRIKPTVARVEIKSEGVPALLVLITAEESRMPGDLPEGWA